MVTTTTAPLPAGRGSSSILAHRYNAAGLDYALGARPQERWPRLRTSWFLPVAFIAFLVGVQFQRIFGPGNSSSGSSAAVARLGVAGPDSRRVQAGNNDAANDAALQASDVPPDDPAPLLDTQQTPPHDALPPIAATVTPSELTASVSSVVSALASAAPSKQPLVPGSTTSIKHAPAPLDDFIWYPPASPGEEQAAFGTCPKPFSSVLVIIVLTHARATGAGLRRGHCRSLWKCAAYNDYSFVILGDTTTKGDTQAGPYKHLTKITAAQQFLSDMAAVNALDDNTLVVFHDALDVLAADSIRALYACISEMWCRRGFSPRKDVLLLGERGLWPPSDAYNDGNYPKAAADYYKINSGLYAGNWRAMLEFLTASLDRQLVTKTCHCDDQEQFNALYTNQPEWTARLRLDSEQMCFGSTHQSEVEYRFQEPVARWRNQLTGTTPLLLHFNGGGKPWLDAALATQPGTKLKWDGPELRDRKLLMYGNDLASSKIVPYREICSAEYGER